MHIVHAFSGAAHASKRNALQLSSLSQKGQRASYNKARYSCTLCCTTTLLYLAMYTQSVCISQQFRALIPGPWQHAISPGRACFRILRAMCSRNREWTDFIRMISRSRRIICMRTGYFESNVARERAILYVTEEPTVYA